MLVIAFSAVQICLHIKIFGYIFHRHFNPLKILYFLLQNPELEARVQKLKLEEQNREYAKMVRNVDPQVWILETFLIKNISYLCFFFSFICFVVFFIF